MQDNDPILLFTVLRDWFNNLKPLFITLNSLNSKEKLSVTDKQNLINLMRGAGKSCQRIIDFEDEIRSQFENLVNEVSVFKQKKFELTIEVDDLEIKKKDLASENNFLKESVAESSTHLKNTIEKLKELNSQEVKLTENIEREKDEECQIEKRIEDKKALLKEMDSLDSVANFLTDTQNQTHDDVVAQNAELFSKNLFLSSRLEIIEIILSMLDTLTPNLKQVWNLIREILECSEQEVIDNKISSIGDLIIDAFETDSNQSDEKIKKEKEIIGQEVKSAREGDNIDELSKKLALLNIECEAREQKSNVLLSKIELRNVALTKLEEYFKVVQKDIATLENKYNDIAEKIKSLVLINRNNKVLQTLPPLDEEFYFEEYHKKLFSFYDTKKNKVSNLINKSYEKLKNNERLLSLKQKELSIIEERTKKEFPNYELKIANLRLRLSNKDKEIESLNNSIKEYIEKLKSIEDNLENHLENHKKVQDSFTYEKESLLQKIIELEHENKKCIEDCNNLKEECDNLKGDNHNLKEESNNLKEDNHNLKENCDNLQKGIDHLKEDNDTLKQLLNELQAKCDNYKSKIDELENQILSGHATSQSNIGVSNAVEQDDATNNIDNNQEDNGPDRVIVETGENVPDINFELDKLKVELSEQIQKRNDTEKALLEIEKINVSLASQISKRDNLISEYEEEIKNLKEKLNESSDTLL